MHIHPQTTIHPAKPTMPSIAASIPLLPAAAVCNPGVGPVADPAPAVVVAFVAATPPGAVTATMNVLVLTPPGPVAISVEKNTVGVRLSVVVVAVRDVEGVVELIVMLL